MSASGLQVSFRHASPSPALRDEIESQYAKLAEHHPDLRGADVVVEPPSAHHRHGDAYHLSVKLRIPGEVIVVGQAHKHADDHEDPYRAVHDAFAVAERRLSERSARLRDRERRAKG